MLGIFTKYPFEESEKIESLRLTMSIVENETIIPESQIYLISDLVTRWRSIEQKISRLEYLPRQVVTNIFRKT
jgi:hypothetical protein